MDYGPKKVAEILKENSIDKEVTILNFIRYSWRRGLIKMSRI